MTTAVGTRTWARTGRPLGDSLYGDLCWSRPSVLRRELVLEAGSETLAVLRWEKVLGFEAIGECGEGRWIFARHRTGSLRGQALVRDPGTQAVVATFTRGWRGTGGVRFASGVEFAWRREGFWRTRCFWSSPRHEHVVAYALQFGWHRRYAMEVDPGAHRVPELPILVLLGAYLMTMDTAKSSH